MDTREFLIANCESLLRCEYFVPSDDGSYKRVKTVTLTVAEGVDNYKTSTPDGPRGDAVLQSYSLNTQRPGYFTNKYARIIQWYMLTRDKCSNTRRMYFSRLIRERAARVACAAAEAAARAATLASVASARVAAGMEYDASPAYRSLSCGVAKGCVGVASLPTMGTSMVQRKSDSHAPSYRRYRFGMNFEDRCTNERCGVSYITPRGFGNMVSSDVTWVSRCPVCGC